MGHDARALVIAETTSGVRGRRPARSDHVEGGF
jgi:hypothetical protein